MAPGANPVLCITGTEFYFPGEKSIRKVKRDHLLLSDAEAWNSWIVHASVLRLVSNALLQWFPNGVSGGTTRCVAKLKKKN
jgi:hypothetical protein